MDFVRFSRNGIVVNIPIEKLESLQRDTTCKEKETSFNKKTHFHKQRVVHLTTVKSTSSTTATVKLPKYLTPFHFINS